MSNILLEDKQKFKHGEFDKCHICIGLVRYLGFVLGDLNKYLCDFTPISPITLVLAFWDLIANLSESNQVIGERMKLKAMRIKDTCKGGSK